MSEPPSAAADDGEPEPPPTDAGLDQPAAPPEPPVPTRAEVMRNFRKNLARPDHRGAGKGRKPTGGNPRFR
jgi:hypothetical protein